jgi:hypothetical protein
MPGKYHVMEGMASWGNFSALGGITERRSKVNAEPADDSDPEPEHSAVSLFNPKLLTRQEAAVRSEYLFWGTAEMYHFRRDVCTLGFMLVRKYE